MQLAMFGGASIIINQRDLYKLKYEDELKKSDNGDLKESLKKLDSHLAFEVSYETIREKIEDIKYNPDKYWYLFDEELWSDET